MPDFPPLECLRFFDAAARRQSFARAAEEFGVTPAAVAHRVRMLEDHVGAPLFRRFHHAVRLNQRGRRYHDDVQRILADILDSTERQRAGATTRRLRLVAVEVMAEMWLTPRLTRFKTAWPKVVIELETDHREVDPQRRDFDLWIAFTNHVAENLEVEVLFAETLVPVCSPALLERLGRPESASDVQRWPLLYDLHWESYWAYWFSHHAAPAPDLSEATGFRLYSMLVQAAVAGMGAALGHSLMIANELRSGALVPIFGPPVPAPARYLLVTAPGSAHKSEVRAFRQWLLNEASETDSDPASRAPP